MKRPHLLLFLALLGLGHPLLAQKKASVKPNALKQAVQATVDAQFADMTELSDKIWAFEEIAFQFQVF